MAFTDAHLTARLDPFESTLRTGFRDAWMEAADWAQKGKAPAGHPAEQGPNFDLKYVRALTPQQPENLGGSARFREGRGSVGTSG